MSIKNLAKNIREGKIEPDNTKASNNPEPVKSKDVKPKKKNEVKHKKKNKDSEIPEYFEELKIALDDKDYNNKATTYIDKDISEVLSVIKSKGKIPISSLLSYIVENWIKEHKEDIKKLPSNRYLK